MKKIVVVFIVALLVGAVGIAEIDLSGMTFEELVELKDKINLAIWNSEEWEEVEVPHGVWVIGQDIPAGKWVIKCADVNRSNYFLNACYFKWGDELNDDGISINKRSGSYDVEIVYNPNHVIYEAGHPTEYIWDAKEGQYFIVETTGAPALFSPYSGKPSLKFKKK